MAKEMKSLKSVGNAGNYPVANLLDEAIALNKDPAVGEILRKCKYMNDGLDEYLDKICSEPTRLQRKIYEDTFTEPWDEVHAKGQTLFRLNPVGVSGHTEGAFLKMMAELTKAERILEVGMFTGHSAVSFGASKYSKEVTSLELDPYFEKFLRARTKGDPIDQKLRVIIGPAMDGLKKLKSEGKTFDLIFIDADKTNYPNYYKFIMDNGLLVPGGTILVDNALLFGQVYPEPTTEGGKAVAELNEIIRKDNRVEKVLLPLRDGVVVVRSKLD